MLQRYIRWLSDSQPRVPVHTLNGNSNNNNNISNNNYPRERKRAGWIVKQKLQINYECVLGKAAAHLLAMNTCQGHPRSLSEYISQRVHDLDIKKTLYCRVC